MPIDINPAHPLPEHKAYLLKLFKQQPYRVFWSANIYHKIMNNGEETLLALKQSIIRRENKTGENRFDITEIQPANVIGQGCFGTVYGSRATIKINETEELVVKKKTGEKERAIKVILLPTTSATKTDKILTSVMEEFELCQTTPHIHMKKPVWTTQNLFIVMRRLHGKELFKVLVQDSGIYFLNILQRFKLTFAVIDAVQEQIFDVNLVHCDLKPENIIVNMGDPDNYIANVIDWAFAKRVDAKRARDDVGSPSYASPEALQNKKTTQLSDVYALGRILALIWRVNVISYNYDDELSHAENVRRILRFAKENNYVNMFIGIKKLDEHAKTLMQAAIEIMTAYEPEYRVLRDFSAGAYIEPETKPYNLHPLRRQFEKAFLAQFPNSDPMTISHKPRTSLPVAPHAEKAMARRSLDAIAPGNKVAPKYSPSTGSTNSTQISPASPSISSSILPTSDFIKTHKISVKSSLKTSSNKIQKEGKKLLQKAGDFFRGTPKSKHQSSEHPPVTTTSTKESAKPTPPDAN